MQLTRREFAKKVTFTAVGARLAMLIATGSTIELAGCNIIDDIENWVPVGEAAVNSILAILTANGVPIAAGISAVVNVIETAFNDLIAAAKEYQSTTPPPVGTLAKIETIMQDISDQFSSFVSQLSGIAGTILTVVVALVKVVISTIGGFVSQLPTSARALAKLNSHQAVSASPVHRTRRAFKKDWNATLESGKTQGVACPASAYLPVSFWEKF
jgi:hypothetical protein